MKFRNSIGAVSILSGQVEVTNQPGGPVTNTGAVGSGVAGATGWGTGSGALAQSINQRTPWESGQTPWCLYGDVICNNPAAASMGSFAWLLGASQTLPYTVPSGQILRITNLNIMPFPNTASAPDISGWVGVGVSGAASDMVALVPWFNLSGTQNPNPQNASLESCEIPGVRQIWIWGFTEKPYTITVGVALNGFLYTP